MIISGRIAPVHLSPGDIFSGLLGGTVGALSPSSAPIKVQAQCSHELEECWVARGRNKDNREQVIDACWKESKRCPKVCKDEYFSRRKAGISALKADPLFYGRNDEDSSCVPGVDALTHTGRKVRPNNSTVRVTVMLGGKPVKAKVGMIPLDEQGNKHPTTTDPGYFKTYQPNTTGRTEPLRMRVHAGRYRLRVSSPRYYPDKHSYPLKPLLSQRDRSWYWKGRQTKLCYCCARFSLHSTHRRKHVAKDT